MSYECGGFAKPCAGLQLMNYDNDSITAYLLGNASDQETERFDELSIADDEFADALSAAEDDLVDAYIDGELAGSNLRRFETFYLVSPLRRRKVMFAEAFRQFSNRHTMERPAAGHPPQRAPHTGFFSKFRAFPVWQLGFAAAALVFACLAGWLAIQNSELRRRADEIAAIRNAEVPKEQESETHPARENAQSSSPSDKPAATENERIDVVNETEKGRNLGNEPAAAKPSPRPQSAEPVGPRIVAFALAPQLRSAGKIPEFSIPAGREQAAFQIEMESAGYDTYAVELRGQSSGSLIWKSASLSPSAKQPNSIRVIIPTRLLPAQIYTATVSGSNKTGGSEIIGDYTFRIVQ